MRLILPFVFLGWKSTNNWPDWILLHQRTAAGELHSAGGWIQCSAGSLEAWNFGAVGLQWYSPDLLSFRGPKSQMKPYELEKLFQQQQNPQSCNITSPCLHHRPIAKISARKEGYFAIKEEWSTLWDRHLIYSMVWIFWLAYGLNQCSKENCDFSVCHAVVCHFICFFVFTSESGCLILCIERMIVSLRWRDSFLRGKYCKQNSWNLSGGPFPDVIATALHNCSPEVENSDHILWGVEPFFTQRSQWTKDNFCITS